MSLKIGVHEFFPVTQKTQRGWSGFEIELWEEVSRRLVLDCEFVEEKNLERLLQRTAKGEFDVGVAGVTRTVERTGRLEMSFLTLDTGLMVGARAERSLSLRELAGKVFSRATMGLLSVLFGFALLIAHGYWLIERGHSVSHEYVAGVFDSFWWAFVTFSTVGYGDVFPETAAGQVFALLAILLGLALFGLFIAQLSSALTLRRLKQTIRGVDDLAGKVVAAKAETTAIEVIKSHGGRVKEFASVSDAVDSVLRGGADAVVADAPALQAMKDKPELVLVGGLFARQSYAFVFPKTSQLTEEINTTLVAIREDGTYDQLHNKYFK